MYITLKSGVLTVKEKVTKTYAKMFRDLEIGDRLVLSVPVKSAGRRDKGTYATEIKVTNLETNETVYKTFNQIDPILSCFIFEEKSQ